VERRGPGASFLVGIACGAITFAPLGLGCAKGGARGEASRVAGGAELFVENCAACHGATGAGDGPAAASLDPRPADLRRVAARREGVFPEAEILQVIDGRDPIAAHGSREMPIWGKHFDLDQSGGLATEGRRRGQIQLLIEYLKTLQLPQ
jgi:mono/diheme cytochrome c family protein